MFKRSPTKPLDAFDTLGLGLVAFIVGYPLALGTISAVQWLNAITWQYTPWGVLW